MIARCIPRKAKFRFMKSHCETHVVSSDLNVDGYLKRRTKNNERRVAILLAPDQFTRLQNELQGGTYQVSIPFSTV